MEYTMIVQHIFSERISPQIIDSLVAQLNRNAREGWIVRTCATYGDALIFTLERPKPAEHTDA